METINSVKVASSAIQLNDLFKANKKLTIEIVFLFSTLLFGKSQIEIQFTLVRLNSNQNSDN